MKTNKTTLNFGNITIEAEIKEHTKHLGFYHLGGEWLEFPEPNKLDPQYDDLKKIYDEHAYSGTLYPRGEGHLKKVSHGKYIFKPWGVGGVSFGYDGYTNNPYLPFSDVYHSRDIPGRTADERKQWLIRNGFIK